MLTGCTTSKHVNYVDQLRGIIIQELVLEKQPVQEALHVLRTEWKKQTACEMPVAEIFQTGVSSESTNQLVSLHAKHITFLEALKLIANISGCRLLFQQDGLVLTDIWPAEFMYSQLIFDEDIRAGLGLGDKLDPKAIRNALASRGVDFSRDDMEIKVLDKDIVVIGGFTENAELVRSILVLIKSGYEVHKR